MNSEKQTPIQSFQSLDLPEPIAKALVSMKYDIPTPIQSRGIPLIMQGKDLIGIAQTGTGKTAAFGIPLVTALVNDKNAQAVILVPTRELATQVYDVMKKLCENVKSIKCWVIIGGTSMYAQVKSLPKQPRLIIATPGRLMDHLQQKTFNLANVKMIVLDEADRMLDIGFEPQIRQIFKFVPKERQTLLFSATFPKTIERLTREYMNEPARLTIGKVSEPVKEIEQKFISTNVADKNALLVQELQVRTGSVLVFVRTKHKADRVAKMLMREKFEAERIHGARTQGQRSRAILDFRNMKLRILVATDVASRGLDIPHIEHVINYDLPEAPEDYIHRIGRTARAGAKGESLSFITGEDKSKWFQLSRHLTSLGMKMDASIPKAVVSIELSKAPDEPTKEMGRFDGEHRRQYGRPKHRPVRSRPPGRSDSRGPSSSAPRGREGSEGPRSFNRSDSRPRITGNDRPPSRFSKTAFASNDRPRSPRERNDSRDFNRSSAPRGEGRSFSRPENNDNDRPRTRFAKPAFGSNDSRPRTTDRSAAPRGRSDSRDFNRPDSRPRSYGSDRPAPRFAKPGFGSNDSRPRSNDRSAAPRGRTDSRDFNRSSAPRGDRPASRFAKPGFGSNDSRPRTNDRPAAPRGRTDSRDFNRSDSRPRTFGSGRPNTRPSTGRPSRFKSPPRSTNQ